MTGVPLLGVFFIFELPHNTQVILSWDVLLNNWHSCLLSPRELHALVKSHSCLKGPSHNQLEGGISFGIGAFNLVRLGSIVWNRVFVPDGLSGLSYPQTLSLFPPRILKVLEFAGFSGDKVCCLNVLHNVSRSSSDSLMGVSAFRNMVCPCCVKVLWGWTCAPCCALCCCSATTPSSRSY